MLKLPVELIHNADQARACGDDTVNHMCDEIRTSLDEGTDSTTVWWTVATSITCCATPEVAATLASALLRLAQHTR